MPLEFIDPRGSTAPAGAGMRLAPRLRDLSGARIGVLDNGKLNADRLLRLTAQLLCAEYGTELALMRRKDDHTNPAPQEMVAELVEASDFVICGVGD